MRLTSGYEERKARIEMLPLIDIVFLLLVFFIYAMLSMTIHRGLEVELLPGGSIRIGHGRSSRTHDDYADALALAVSEARDYIEVGGAMATGVRDSYKLHVSLDTLLGRH